MTNLTLLIYEIHFFLGGLIGLAAMAIGMGEESASYVSELVNMAFPVVEFSREGYKIRKVFG